MFVRSASLPAWFHDVRLVCRRSMEGNGDLPTMCAIHSAQIAERQLTDAEERFLHGREPTAALRFSDAEGISQGRQSRVSVLEYDRDGKTHQVIWKRMGANKRLTHEEAHQLWLRLDSYRTSLLGSGWTVPQLLYSAVVEISKVEHQIFSYEQFIPGGDGDSLLADPSEPNFRKWHFVTEVLRRLYAYPARRTNELGGRELTLLPHGLDLKAANLVLEPQTDQLYFVDLFGPKELTEDGNWRVFSPKIDPLPPRNLMAVCATREGCLLRFWRLARRLWEPEYTRRGLLTAELMEQLSRFDPPHSEFDFIEQEIADGFPWLNELYSERQV